MQHYDADTDKEKNACMQRYEANADKEKSACMQRYKADADKEESARMQHVEVNLHVQYAEVISKLEKKMADDLEFP